MAKKSVVFTPLNTPPQGDQVNAPSKIEEPQYPDVGVSFAGYSKTPLSGNQFRLNPQQRIDYNAGLVFGGVNSSQTFSLSSFTGRTKMYITKIIAHGWHSGQTIVRLERSDGSSLCHFAIDTNTYNLEIEPIVPLEINLSDNSSNNYILARFLQVSTAAGDALYLDIYGWTE